MMKMSNSEWALSFLSSVAGEFTSCCGEGETGRDFFWAAGKKPNDYWLTYNIDNNGKPSIHIYVWHAPTPAMYSVMGYAEYHEINCEVRE
jgi:hypothetical protein